MNKKNFSRFDKASLAMAILSVASLSSCSKTDMGKIADQPQGQDQATAAPDKYIVVLKGEGDLSTSIKELSSRQGLNIASSDIFSGPSQGFTAQLSQEQLSKLKTDPSVSYIEQDQVVALARTKTTSAPQVTALSGTVTADQNIAGEITPWGVTRMGGTGDASGKTAWIIDSGIDFEHADLNVDKTRSKSFLSSTNGGNYSSADDEFGHGTGVAGVIGAKSNGVGSVGIAPGVSLVSLKVMDYAGRASVGSIVRAVNWAATYGKAGDVVNISLGCNASTTLDDAVKACAAKGIHVAIAAGNNRKDCYAMSPQRVNAYRVYTVSGMNADNSFWYSSNYGAGIDFAAPANNVHLTLNGGSYGYGSGTSYAAPHLAGLLLINSGTARVDGYITSDPDGRADKIAHK